MTWPTYLPETPTLIDDFNGALGDYTVTKTGTAGDVAVSTDANLRVGGGGIRLLAPSTAGNYSRIRRGGMSLGLTGTETAYFCFYVDRADDSCDTNLQFKFIDTTSATKYFYLTIENPVGTSYTGGKVLGYRVIPFRLSQMTVFNAATWAEMAGIDVQVSTTSGSAQSSIIADAMYVLSKFRRPKVVFTLDDGYASWETFVKPIFDDYGWAATAFVGSDRVTAGAGSDLDVSGMQALIASGWDFHNHSKTETSMSAMSESEITAEVEACEDFLIAQGVDRSFRAIAYPYGHYSATVLSTVESLGFDFGRWAQEQPVNYFNTYSQPPPHQFLAPPLSFDLGRSAASFLTLLNANIRRGQNTIIMGHDFVAADPTGAEILQSVATDIFTGIRLLEQQGLLDIVTLRELYLDASRPSISSRPAAARAA